MAKLETTMDSIYILAGAAAIIAVLVMVQLTVSAALRVQAVRKALAFVKHKFETAVAGACLLVLVFAAPILGLATGSFLVWIGLSVLALAIANTVDP